MEVGLFNGFLDALGLMLEGLLRWLNGVDLLRENLPGLSRMLEHVEDAEDTSRRRFTLLLVIYTTVASLLMWFFRGRSKGRGKLNLKYK